MNRFYPMMVDLTSHRCLVVGGGKVAERKIARLLVSDADVIVVSPVVTQTVKKWAEIGKIVWYPRFYEEKDGENCSIVIAATNQREVNHQIYKDAKKRKQWINVVDQPSLCNFTVPSTIHRGQLTLSISTGGASPSLAKTIRQELEQIYGEEYALFLELAKEMREEIQARVLDPAKRSQILKSLVSRQWIEACRSHPDQVKKWMQKWLDQELQAEH
ncbi:precorrin-2 dehydrogenase/sirohydrochlorin ferrochelatase family protein [Thermoflavimicrobium daqui]|jgi:precorrin-2 dehydrogenase/sirohydrochlorin ferrochelatase|uniref:precorrin-2 dehydrogenase n=1 Tax=Thermoflavimicrobium daqui TaxID=2137476 RepID=A0A364K8R1_9BACL|nr:bifunctional precorrin-2 dehydrogenase/sirohydrochlorin ferrochelatase [Thermoflavimicrobium daqui]RAL26681.1 hypothetical protein DL897_01115 [Thermoflavimicrobium daqui]